MLISQGFIGNSEKAHEIEELYHSLATDEYIEEIRRPAFGGGRLDIEATAQAAGLEACMKPLEGLSGLYKGKPSNLRPCVTAYVDSQQSILQQDLTLGHEVGHHFLERVCQLDPFQGLDHAQAEDFCELFGLRLVLDRPAVEQPGQLVLMGGFGG